MDTVLSALATGAPLVAVTGPAGIGRTTALGEAGDLLAAKGMAVTAIRFTRDGDAIPVRSPGTEASFVPLAPVAGAHRDPGIARRAASETAAELLGGALLIDDLQWSDRDSRAVLGALVRGGLTGKPVTCVCAVRTPIPAVQLAWWRDLREGELVSAVRLRPMGESEIADEIVTATSVAPDDELVRRVAELSRGIPAAVRDSIEMLLSNGSVRALGDEASLAPAVLPVQYPLDNRFLRRVRALDPKAGAAAMAACVFAPLGETVPRLVAEVLETTEAEVVALLDVLRQEGILHRGRNGQSWRALVPVFASSLTGAMAPFERRQLAARAVTAVWTGEARCADLDQLADLVVDAGWLIDPALACQALLDRSAEVGARTPSRASRWLDAAVDRAQNPAQRATAMLAHTELCYACGDHERGLRGVRLLLNGFADQLAPEVAPRLHVLAERASGGTGQREALRLAN
ncbi:hypothetical protein [Amycolatopsis samaneae]|uniref:Uncharacterized protein n=1 Tax=Amycolatopsis samaneae TaxID=664691 RepID=A0ABW5GRF5_9PSEU